MIERNPSSLTPQLRLIRLLVVAAFFVLVGRLYQLQVVQGESYQVDAERNRLRRIEIPAPRGVIYDRNGEVLARNRPSYEISIVPSDLPQDDLDTEADEEQVAILDLLFVLGADQDVDLTLRIQQRMFRKLGYLDYTRVLDEAAIPVILLALPQNNPASVDGEGNEVDPGPPLPPVLIPDINEPLPIIGLAALVQRAVDLGRQGSAFEAVPILDVVSQAQAFFLNEEAYRLPGMRVQQKPVREYVYAELTSHLLGFMGPIPAELAEDYTRSGYTNPNETVGLSGIEASYQENLRGIPGERQIEVDILGRESRTVGEPVQPIPGQNLYLGIDIRLQRVMFESLSARLRESGAPSGVALAMDPRNGQVLGLVSLPAFDNNVFSEGLDEKYLALEQDPLKPLINYAIGGLYSPGSTFKIVTASGALEEGVINPSTRIVDSGPLYLPNRFFPNDFEQAQKFVSWNHKLGINHGPLTVIDALALSNDIFFYWAGGGYLTQFQGLGDSRLAKWAKLFGYGEPTGIDLPGEVGPSIPDDQWKRVNWAESWVTGDSYNMAIGQGYLLATPLQVLESVLPIANGGFLYQPQVVYRIVDTELGRAQEFTPRLIREVPLAETTLSAVREGLWRVVNSNYGTAPNGRLPDIVVAGKTGTAEFCEYIPELEDCRRDKDDNLPTHAWYVAFAPFEAPEIAVLTFIYDGGEGSEAAVPVATQILDTYFKLDLPNIPSE